MARHSKRSKPRKKTSTNPQAPQAQPKTKRSHYQVLDVSPSADVVTIREHYLNKLHQFSPEHDPEEFQSIRLAYEVLTDAKARHRYDKERFYGTTVAKLEETLERAEERGMVREIIYCLRRLIDIEPTVDRWVELAETYQDIGEKAAVTRAYEGALDVCESEAERIEVRTKLAYTSGNAAEIVEGLLAIVAEYPSAARQLAADIFRCYKQTGQVAKGMAFYRRLIPRRKYLTAEDFQLYIEWLAVMVQEDMTAEAEKLLNSKIISAAETAAFGPHKKAIIEMMVRNIKADGSSSHPVVLELARIVDPKDPTVRELWRKYSEIALLDGQVSRMFDDPNVPNSIVREFLQAYTTVLPDPSKQALSVLEFRPESATPMSYDDAMNYFRQAYPRVYYVFSEMKKMKVDA